MEKKHVVVTKEGMRVGVKEVGREGYVDRTQRCVSPPFSAFCFGFGLAVEGCVRDGPFLEGEWMRC